MEHDAAPLSSAAAFSPTLLPHRRETATPQWSHKVWQTHVPRHRSVAYSDHWPRRATFRAQWPLLADDLIVADWGWEVAYSGRWWGPSEEDVQAELKAILAVPREEPPDWRESYAAELEQSLALALALAGQNPIASVARRARLSPLETDALRLWTAGDTVESISRTMGQQRRAVETLVDRALFKVRELAGGGVCGGSGVTGVEEPCSTAPIPSWTSSSPGSSSMLAASCAASA